MKNKLDGGLIIIIILVAVIMSVIMLSLNDSHTKNLERNENLTNLINEIKTQWTCDDLFQYMKERDQVVTMNVVPETWIVKECWK
jgi:hypothetical protein